MENVYTFSNSSLGKGYIEVGMIQSHLLVLCFVKMSLICFRVMSSFMLHSWLLPSTIFWEGVVVSALSFRNRSANETGLLLPTKFFGCTLCIYTSISSSSSLSIFRRLYSKMWSVHVCKYVCMKKKTSLSKMTVEMYFISREPHPNLQKVPLSSQHMADQRRIVLSLAGNSYWSLCCS